MNKEKVKFLIKWIVVDMLPLSLVDSNSFQNFIQKLDIGFRCPKRTAFTSEIMTEFDYQYNQIVNVVKSISSKCSLITDI